MYQLIPWTPDLDLDEFYRECARRGFPNNASKRALVDGVLKYPKSQLWILYSNGVAVGSVGAHDLDIFGPNAFRICVRTCVLTDKTHIPHIRTKAVTIEQHQNITAQLYIPACIEWAGRDKDIFISTHESEHASHKAVHRLYMPSLVRIGVAENYRTQVYRGHEQTFWKINVEEFYNQLMKYPRWT